MAQTLLQLLIVCDVETASSVWASIGAAGAQRTGRTGLSIKGDRLAEFEGLGLVTGARDELVTDVDVEVRFGEAAVVVTDIPGATDDLATASEHVLYGNSIEEISCIC